MLRLVPFFSPVRGVRPDGFLRQRRFNVRPVCGLPFPGDAFDLVVFGEAPAPDRLKQPGPGPLLEAFVQRCQQARPRFDFYPALAALLYGFVGEDVLFLDDVAAARKAAGS